MTETKRKAPPQAWKPGQSGNPSGRKPGSGEVAALRTGIREHAPAIIQKLTEAALAGDTGAARLLLERVCAPLKAEEQAAPLALPDGTLTRQGRAVLGAVADGELALGQGAALLTSLGTLAKVREADELEARIAALEATRGHARPGRGQGMRQEHLRPTCGFLRPRSPSVRRTSS